MKRFNAYVINVDEDVAEKSFQLAVEALGLLNLVRIPSRGIVVEPHDDFRGIAASFEYSFIDEEAGKNKKASKGLQDLMQSLIKAQLWKITNVKVITETGESTK